MATTTIPWGDGSGDNIYLTYPSASGDQTVEVSSDANGGYTDRTQTITFTASANGTSSVKVLTITQEGVPEPYIVFVDSNVESICVSTWGDGVGLKPSRAAQVANSQINTVFRSNRTITSFDEFVYFTGITTIYGTSSSPYGSFSNCSSLLSITIPPNVTAINYCAFRGATSLNHVTFTRNGATTIAANAFYGTKITRLDFPSIGAFLNTTWNGDQAFFQVNDNNGRRSHDLYIGGERQTEMVIPSNTTSIKRGAFAGATSLTGTLTIPSTVTSIGDFAFINCWNLTDLYIYSNVSLDSSCVYASAKNTLYVAGNMTHGQTAYRISSPAHVIIGGNFSSGGNTTQTLTANCVSCRIRGNINRPSNYMHYAGSGATSKMAFFELGGTFTGNGKLFYNNNGVVNGCIVHLANTEIAGNVTQLCASYARVTKIYVGPGESQAGDQAVLNKYLADSSWSTYASKLDLWWNYSGSYKE